jgi:hypothetical protein
MAEIAESAGAIIMQHPFENHPYPMGFCPQKLCCKNALGYLSRCRSNSNSRTLQTAGQLFGMKTIKMLNGIYFNRKNFFKGRWIKHGGYYPFYLLKMIRFNIGFSDTNENMDHRLIVPGNTLIWKQGHILEENLKENKISFWIEKHNKYSDLLAHEELERMLNLRQQTVKPHFWGSPDERTAWLKQRWWKLPRYMRPMLYFIYRIIFKLGILDGKTGLIFHFMQAYWFRLVVDIKIDELLKQRQDEGR